MLALFAWLAGAFAIFGVFVGGLLAKFYSFLKTIPAE